MWWLSNFIYLHVSETLTALLVISCIPVAAESRGRGGMPWWRVLPHPTSQRTLGYLHVAASIRILWRNSASWDILGSIPTWSAFILVIQWYCNDIYILHTLYEVSKIPPINSSQGLDLWRFWIRWSVLWYIVMCHLRYPWTIRWTR